MAFIEYMHRFKSPTGTLIGVPDDLYKKKKTRELEEYGKYLGRFSKYEIIGMTGGRMTGAALVFIDRNLYKMNSIEETSLPPIPKYDQIRTMGGWHGSDVDTNLVVGFSKKQLMEIANSMQMDDIFNIAHLPEGYNP